MSACLPPAGAIVTLGEIPTEGERGPECVKPGFPSHNCVLLHGVAVVGGTWQEAAGGGRRAGMGGRGAHHRDTTLPPPPCTTLPRLQRLQRRCSSLEIDGEERQALLIGEEETHLYRWLWEQLD